MKRSVGASGRGNMRNGLISLLTVVVVLSISTAAVLTVSTAHAMHALAQRQATMTSEGYEAERSAQALLAGIDEELAAARAAHESGQAVADRIEKRINRLLAEACVEGVTATYGIEKNTLTCTFTTQSNRMLRTSIVLGQDATYDVAAWKLTAAPEDTSTDDVLWTGSTAKE